MKKYDKYITEFNTVGICGIDVDALCNEWKNNYKISRYEDEYTLVITNKKGDEYFLKVKVSESDAGVLIDRLSLCKVDSETFRLASTYYTKSHVESRLIDLEEKLTGDFSSKLNMQEKEFIESLIYYYKKSLNNG